ncbi:hypothetical protein BCN_4547 [Bacillus cereus NC7401]|nr:hypothetical protein BCN_4547 [Bacillus cereus NC7401]
MMYDVTSSLVYRFHIAIYERRRPLTKRSSSFTLFCSFCCF